MARWRRLTDQEASWALEVDAVKRGAWNEVDARVAGQMQGDHGSGAGQAAPIPNSARRMLERGLDQRGARARLVA